MDIKKGDMVTGEPEKYFDGRPVEGWPCPHYVGKVLRVEEFSAGGTYARVKYSSGRITWENIARIKKVN